MQRIYYLFLRGLSSVQYRLRRRLTAAGWFGLAVMVISAAVGIDTDLTMAYQIFTFLAALLLLSLLFGLGFRRRFKVDRTLPPFVTAGDRFSYRATITNLSDTALDGLSMIETFADPRPDYGRFRSSAGIKGVLRRWQALVAENRNGEIREQPLPRLLPGRDTEMEIEVVADHRGYIDFSAVTIARSDPLGMVKALVTVPLRQTLMVLPKRYTLPDLQLPGTRIYQHGGVTLAASKGDTEEFVGLRDYRPGDPLQQVHWKSFARIGKPVVREYQDEFFERHALVLDTFVQDAASQVFEEAVSLAASFVCTIETQENLLDLMFIGDQAYTYSAGVGQLH
ncbi:MAG: DUF58 domain-containing protein, partial [Gammaproteobacteria bacterium]|nr:DUF58 domain-containing protein [Gammaproteobacteria bacterium]